MQRYFAHLLNNEFIINSDDIFHILKVMRMKINDQFEVVDDNKLYIARIESINPFRAFLDHEINRNTELNGYVRLFVCLIKGEKIDLVIQKATELGVNEIVLVNSSRCVVKIENDKKENKLLRYNKIIKEACEQSKRMVKPILKDIINFQDIKNYEANYSFIPYEATEENSANLRLVLNNIYNKKINVIVGPEGGFSKDEVNYALSCGFKEISLGKRILRSETASLYILSLLSFYMD